MLKIPIFLSASLFGRRDFVRVTGTVLEHFKMPKVVAAKRGQRRRHKRGHRQQCTRIRIDEIRIKVEDDAPLELDELRLSSSTDG